MPRAYDDTQIDRLLAQGLSINQTADMLKIPRSSLKDYLQQRKRRVAASQVNPSPPASTSTNALMVYPGQPLSTSARNLEHVDELSQLLPVLREMAREWMEHRQSAQVNMSLPKSTVRWTYHLDARFVQAVKDYAKLHRLSESAVVNLALQQFFQSRQGG